ncbi:sporulation YhaL family protein [Pseudogracilibacillus sp. SE30717A]|uniref:sporulation YhaL family protein n=1 Tax=Pseudogracilibacillus sp. SE30717A TaxID=3098293 RepID=UPI00300DDC1C
MLFNIPWWVILMILFICFSGYMSFRAMQAERKLEQQFIEREGQIFMERIEQDRAKRQESN